MTNPTIPHGTKEQDMSEELKPCQICGGNRRIGAFPSEDEAKAAAQADFERRVHACLEGYDED